MELPAPVATLAAQLAGVPGVVAVALGGSRATGTHRPDSDWDLGAYYRGALDPGDIRRLGHAGHVSELGEWGPIVNGGAWLTLDGLAVDVLFRELDTVERWTADAERGAFDIVAQNGHLAGAPTYVPVGELALCRPLAGELPRPAFSDALAEAAPPRWEARAGVALLFAQQHEALGDAVGGIGMLANAVLCAAHARLAARREWVLNEKRLAERAGLGGVDLHAGAAEVGDALGIAPLSPR